jgi:hypothetical protein
MGVGPGAVRRRPPAPGAIPEPWRRFFNPGRRPAGSPSADRCQSRRPQSAGLCRAAGRHLSEGRFPLWRWPARAPRRPGHRQRFRTPAPGRGAERRLPGRPAGRGSRPPPRRRRRSARSRAAPAGAPMGVLPHGHGGTARRSPAKAGARLRTARPAAQAGPPAGRGARLARGPRRPATAAAPGSGKRRGLGKEAAAGAKRRRRVQPPGLGPEMGEGDGGAGRSVNAIC